MKWLKITLTGVGQIFLQANGLSGLLIVLAMFCSHWTLGVSCFLGALVGTFTAKILRFPQAEIEQGLYGFNASLAYMCALFTFGLTDSANIIVWLLGALAAIVSTLIMRVFLQSQLIAFTFPFVFTCWFLIWGVAQLHLFGLTQNTPPLPEATRLTALVQPFYAWAEVNFGSHLFTGILLFIAIAINSPLAAAYGLAVAPIATLFAYYLFGIDEHTLSHGLYGFSAVLVACVFAGSQLRDWAYTLIGVLLAVIIQYAIARTGLATYTIGFIIASWLVLWLKNRVQPHQYIQRKLFNSLNP